MAPLDSSFHGLPGAVLGAGVHGSSTLMHSSTPGGCLPSPMPSAEIHIWQPTWSPWGRLSTMDSTYNGLHAHATPPGAHAIFTVLQAVSYLSTTPPMHMHMHMHPHNSQLPSSYLATLAAMHTS